MYSKLAMKAVKSLSIMVWALIVVSSALAQNYSIDWYKIAGGGGTSTGGVYTVSGTIGQHDAGGPMTGGPYSLTGGFWSLVAVQTPGAPLLKVSLTGTNTVLISWPSPSTGFTLQQNSSVNSAGGWATVTQTPSDNGTTKSVVVNPPVGNVFYRLKE
jgi:hypothetical protein